MALHCFVKRRDGMSHEEFLDYWRNHHGPLIRDTPELARWTTRYVQHAAHPKDSSGYDGVAVQEFASWDDFIAMITGPAGELMRDDEANFLVAEGHRRRVHHRPGGHDRRPADDRDVA